MPASEMQMWAKYLEARPIGWKEDLRTSYLLRAFGAKIKGPEVFETLAQMEKWDRELEDEHKMRSTFSRSIFGAMFDAANKGKENGS